LANTLQAKPFHTLALLWQQTNRFSIKCQMFYHADTVARYKHVDRAKQDSLQGVVPA